MHILLQLYCVGSGSEIGRGIFRVLNKLISTLLKLYPSVKIYIYSDCPDIYRKAVDFEVHVISMDPSVLLEHNIDYILCFTNGQGAADLLDYVPPNIQVVSVIHDIIDVVGDKSNSEIVGLFNQKNMYLQLEFQKRCDNSDILCTVSKYSKNDILRYLEIPNNKPIHVLYPAPILENVTDDNKVNQSLKKDSYFLYNGGYCPRKGIEQLICNFLELKLENKLQSKLVLTGKNYLNDEDSSYHILNQLIKYGVDEGHIIDVGFVSDEKLISLYQNALAMVYPTNYEGFGMPLVEAMRAGCPIITCKNSSIYEVCGDDGAYYIDKYDSEDFQKALLSFESLWFVPEKEKLIKNGYELLKRFSWEDTAHKFFKILKEAKDNSRFDKVKKFNSFLKEANNIIDSSPVYKAYQEVEKFNSFLKEANNIIDSSLVYKAYQEVKNKGYNKSIFLLYYELYQVIYRLQKLRKSLSSEKYQ